MAIAVKLLQLADAGHGYAAADVAGIALPVKAM